MRQSTPQRQVDTSREYFGPDITKFALTTDLVKDDASFRTWVTTQLSRALPHEALYCGQLASHSGGYATIHALAIGIPQSYLSAVWRPGLNVRSPILERLLSSNGEAQFFDVEKDWATVCSNWLLAFKAAKWRNLLLLAHREEQDNDCLLTVAAFYNLAPEFTRHALQLQSTLMGHFHSALSRAYANAAASVSGGCAKAVLNKLTSIEASLIALVTKGQSNKQIARALGKSDQTIKHQISTLLRKLGVQNRTELVGMFTNRDSDMD